MLPDEYAEAEQNFLSSLYKTKEEYEDIEIRTRNQSDCEEWREIRRNLLTASDFGKVCRRYDYTPCNNLVKELLYGYVPLNVASLQYGKRNEHLAIDALRGLYGIEIKPCGLFVDKTLPFLGATPEGLINNEGIIEVKCPYSARHLTPEDAIELRKITFWKIMILISVIIGSTKYKVNFMYWVKVIAYLLCGLLRE